MAKFRPESRMSENPAPDIEVFRNLSIFGALTEETILFLRERCEAVAVAAGADFFVQGEMGDSVFVLRTGRVSVLRRLDEECMVLAELGEGFCFGEMALVAISPRTATVRALEDCTALRLRNLSLLELYKHDLEQFTLVQMNLGREVARRLAVANHTLFDYARRCGETTRDAELLSKAADTLK
jgi:CRP/FNR family transcriptional regulator, cyclic AMP receptor protein